MTTSPDSPGPMDVENVPVPPRDDRGDPADVDPEMMQAGDAGPMKPGRGHDRGHGRDDEDDEDDAARRNVGG